MIIPEQKVLMEESIEPRACAYACAYSRYPRKFQLK